MRMKVLAVTTTAVLVIASGGCGSSAPPPRGVADLLAEPAILQAVMARCAESRPSVRDADRECLNARIAVERQAREQEAAEAAARHAEFERKREVLRAQEERQKAAAQAAQRRDGYSLPVVPPDGVPVPAPAAP